MFVLLLSFHWIVIVFLFACAIPGALIRGRFAKKVHRWYEDRTATERQAAFLSALLTTVEPAKEVRLFDLGQRSRGRHFGRFRAGRTSGDQRRKRHDYPESNH